jgi:hypothetical protein
MFKTSLSHEELKFRAFQAIQRCEGCHMVSNVTIYEIEAEPTQSNWCIGAIGVCPGWAHAATKAAIYVEREL